MKTWQFQAASNVPVFEFLPKLSQSFPHLVTLVLIHHEKDGSQMRGNSVVSQCLWVLSINVSMRIYNIPKKTLNQTWLAGKSPANGQPLSWDLHGHPDPRARAMSSRLGACSAIAGSYSWSLVEATRLPNWPLVWYLNYLNVFERQVAIRKGLCGYAAKKVGGSTTFRGWSK